ncbi:MAG: hypothetical protein J7623_13145 [Chitinophaga sp.]|uniref:S41 family peptidase n=1 Tax=Chitinophaga sp. TaxID=1869181 RepID=UPI001B29CD12|nr:S41 family peptidase [Chitinophaga sp.]MBO9729577.1 hypothetical protein [Chitinophaga sp.]
MKRIFCFIALLFFVITKDTIAQHLTTDALRQDLKYYKDTLPAKHVKLYNKITKAQFDDRIATIAAKLDTLTEEGFMIELFRLNAAIGDEHTRIEPKFTLSLPIKFEIFKEGIFVTGILPEDSSYLSCKLVAINGWSVDAVNRKFKEVIKTDNQSYFEIYRQKFFNNPVFLKGLGILPSDQRATFTLQNARQETFDVTLPSAPKGSTKLATVNQYQTLLPYKKGNKKYWYDYDTATKTLYFNYATCAEDPQEPFPDFNTGLFATINNVHPDKIIVDLRFNDGGNSGVLSPFLDSIGQSYLNKKGHLFVLIGKLTFSSAVMNAVYLKRNTHAILIGQMTSGNINCYGENRGFRLPNTQMIIGYSTRYWEVWKGKKGALQPDYPVSYSAKNFFNNRDEALEYVYEH